MFSASKKRQRVLRQVDYLPAVSQSARYKALDRAFQIDAIKNHPVIKVQNIKSRPQNYSGFVLVEDIGASSVDHYTLYYAQANHGAEQVVMNVKAKEEYLKWLDETAGWVLELKKPGLDEKKRSAEKKGPNLDPNTFYLYEERGVLYFTIKNLRGTVVSGTLVDDGPPIFASHSFAEEKKDIDQTSNVRFLKSLFAAQFNHVLIRKDYYKSTQFKTGIIDKDTLIIDPTPISSYNPDRTKRTTYYTVFYSLCGHSDKQNIKFGYFEVPADPALKALCEGNKENKIDRIDKDDKDDRDDKDKGRDESAERRLIDWVQEKTIIEGTTLDETTFRRKIFASPQTSVLGHIRTMAFHKNLLDVLTETPALEKILPSNKKEAEVIILGKPMSIPPFFISEQQLNTFADFKPSTYFVYRAFLERELGSKKDAFKKASLLKTIKTIRQHLQQQNRFGAFYESSKNLLFIKKLAKKISDEDCKTNPRLGVLTSQVLKLDSFYGLLESIITHKEPSPPKKIVSAKESPELWTVTTTVGPARMPVIEVKLLRDRQETVTLSTLSKESLEAFFKRLDPTQPEFSRAKVLIKACIARAKKSDRFDFFSGQRTKLNKIKVYLKAISNIYAGKKITAGFSDNEIRVLWEVGLFKRKSNSAEAVHKFFDRTTVDDVTVDTINQYLLKKKL